MSSPHQPESAPRTRYGRILRMDQPRNEEYDLGTLASVITPNAAFYVRSHGPVPPADGGWRLAVDGLVEQPLSMSLADLAAMAQRQQTVTLECAGNRRTFQDPIPAGVPWGDGAISTAVWTGVPLRAILDRAGVQSAARFVLCSGADQCPTDGGPTHFARSLALDTARDSALLALTMNGEPLPPEHGAPIRIVQPNRYGMDSIKWLRRITVQDAPFGGHFQVNDYRLWYAPDDPGQEIGAVRVFAAIAAPRAGAELSAGSVRVHGAAWTGTGTVESVEVSADGGASWQAASLVSDALPAVWRLWEYTWDAPGGEHLLMARATDSAGNRQPQRLPPNRKAYANNFPLPVPVKVRPSG